MQRQLAHWQQRLLHNLHNEWAKRDIAKAETPLWPWIDDVIDDALDEPSPTTMRDIADAMAAAYVGSADYSTKQMDLDDPNAVLLRINTEAVDYAASRGAEMVGRRYDEDGNLVDNPNADWAITETTRQVLREEITDAVALHWDVDKLADRLADMGIFSDYRAEMIARTETNMAQNQGVLAAGRQARALGLNIKKVWTLGPNPCELCQDAAAEGVIDLDADFGAADEAPPLHPNCECLLELVEGENEIEADTADAAAAVAEQDEVPDYRPGDKTPTPGFDARKAVVAKWANRSPLNTLPAVVDAAPEDQRLLVKIGDVVARSVGATIRENGEKTKSAKGIARVVEKAEQRDGQVARVTDVARMTMLVDRPEQTDRAIAELGKYFEVAAEPWKVTDVLYADRAVNVRLPDGMIAEVQFMDKKMLDAKEGGGHVQFKIMQDSDPEKGPHPDHERWEAAFDKSQEIYGAVLDGYSDDWKAALGIGGTGE